MTMTFLLLLSKLKIGELELINSGPFPELVIRFLFNLGIVLLIVRWLYYTSTRRKDYLFTYVLIGCIIFLICQMLSNVKIEMGFALGLFAIFGILRYRTDQMPIREMTYLFLVIGISVINAVVTMKISVAEQLFANGAMVAITYGFERVWFLRHESIKLVVYEKVHLIKKDKRAELIADLQERTGIEKINRVEIGQIDFLRDTCKIMIYYYEPSNIINRADQTIRGNNGDDD
jgi:hypothetical protein